MEKKKTDKNVVKKASEKEHYQLEICKQFADKISKELDLELGEIKINRSKPFMAPKLCKNGHQICWVLPDFSGFFRLYLFIPIEKRRIIKIKDSKQANNVIPEIKAVADAIIDKSIPKEKNSSKIRTVKVILEQLDKLGNNKGLAIPNGYDAKDKEFVKAIEKHGFKIDTEKKIIIRA